MQIDAYATAPAVGGVFCDHAGDKLDIYILQIRIDVDSPAFAAPHFGRFGRIVLNRRTVYRQVAPLDEDAAAVADGGHVIFDRSAGKLDGSIDNVDGASIFSDSIAPNLPTGHRKGSA